MVMEVLCDLLNQKNDMTPCAATRRNHKRKPNRKKTIAIANAIVNAIANAIAYAIASVIENTITIAIAKVGGNRKRN